MNVADAFARAIKSHGATHVFTLTGSPQDPLIALVNNEGIRLVLGRSERSIIAMADAYARITGKPAFTYVQFGPGATAIVGGISDALWGFSPVVSVSSSVATGNRFRFAYQEVDQQMMLAPVTKWTGYATTPERVPDILQRAVIESLSGAPGPTHIDIASDFFTAEFKGEAVLPAPAGLAGVAAHRPLPASAEIEAAAQLLVQAKRPVILAGGGVHISKGAAALVALAEALAAPVLTSMAGKGSISEVHPLSVGVCGVYSRKVANDVLAEADLCLAVGTKLGAMPTDNFKLPARGTKLIHADIDQRVLGRNFPAAAGMVGDARAVLEALRASLGAGLPNAGERAAWARGVAARVMAWRDRFNEIAERRTVAGRIDPRYVMHCLNRIIGAEDLLVADTGYSAAWAGTLIDMKATGQRYIRAAGSLGWAFPAAIGVKLAAPTKRVFCVTGDGGLGYHLADLETALRLDVPTITVLLNNSTLGFEYTVQKLYYEKRADSAHAFRETNYAEIARAFGAHAERVETADSVMPSLERAAASGKPALLDIVTSPEVGAPYTRYENMPGEREL